MTRRNRERTRELESKLKRLLRLFYSRPKETFRRGTTKIPLSILPYDWHEAFAALECILSGWLTQGQMVQMFERDFASYIGVKNGIMVNSGSSANLLALSVLTNRKLRKRMKPRDEIITPAVTWATTVYPIADVGAVPVLIDVDLETYNMSLPELEKAVGKRTRAIMPVHLLGNPCEMDEIMRVASEHDLFVIEDACEAHGAEFRQKKVGSFGDLSTFSFFVSHHITTIEGGIILTNDENYADMLRGFREFGWIRHLRHRKEIARKYPNIDERYLFVERGYNLRATEIQAAFGLQQIPRLERFISIRRDNARYWTNRLKQYSELFILPNERPGTRHVWFGYPLTVKPDAPFTMKELVRYLESRKIETRPIMAGNIEEQPVMSKIRYRKVGSLKNARTIMRNSFFFGNHVGIGAQERKYVADSLENFIQKYTRR